MDSQTISLTILHLWPARSKHQTDQIYTLSDICPKWPKLLEEIEKPSSGCTGTTPPNTIWKIFWFRLSGLTESDLIIWKQDKQLLKNKTTKKMIH